MHTKLIRNLKPGDVIQLTDTEKHRVTVTHVQESRPGFATGRRMWEAYFTPHLYYGGWVSIHGYSDDRIEVYDAL